MHRARTSRARRFRVRLFPGFGHSRNQNTRLGEPFTLVYVRHASEPGKTEPGIPGLFPDSVIPGLGRF